jgi:hypothetical protein
MHGYVLEINCDQPDVAIPALRKLGLFNEVALYGALIHVVTEDPNAHQPIIQETLRDRNVQVTAIDRIAPSLEDVFIATARRQEKQMQT